MKRVSLLTVLLVALSVSAAAISLDPGINYALSTGTVNAFETVAIPFEVKRTIYINALGVYDYEANGLQGTNPQLAVCIYEWTPSGGFPSINLTLGSLVVGATLSSSSYQAYGSVWTKLNSSVRLDPGWYMAVASGFSQDNPSISGMAPGQTVLNTWNSAVSYGYAVNLGVPIYGIASGGSGTLNAWNWSTSAPVHIAGGTFSVPEPSTYALMASVGLALYLLRRRRNQAAKN